MATMIGRDNTRLYIWERGSFPTSTDKIGNATSVGEGGGETEEVEVTTLESAAKEFMPGYEDYGSMTVTQNITLNEYTKMNNWRKNKTLLSYGLVVDGVDGSTIFEEQGDCWVRSCKRGELTPGGLLTCSTELRVTGEPAGY